MTNIFDKMTYRFDSILFLTYCLLAHDAGKERRIRYIKRSKEKQESTGIKCPIKRHIMSCHTE